jgi:octaprenyl-diphosphate synthase
MSTEASTPRRALYAGIQEDLLRLEDFLKREFAGEEPFILQLFEHIRRFRGKQIRPALLLMVGKLGGGGVSDDQIKIAAVVEMIHTATLVHDDILDDAALRRNVDTLHQRWGERVAVLMGDFIYSRAFSISTAVPGMAEVMSRTTNTICEGELLQIRTRFQPDVDEERYLEIIRKKTAVLYAVACEVGGILSDLHPAEVRKLHDFGLDLGMAFQIVDDCLDYSGEEAVAGKSLGTDLRQGKATLPLLLFLNRLSGAEAQHLRAALREPLSRAAQARIASEIRERGSLKAALARGQEYIVSAKAALSGLQPVLRESLEQVADYVLRRDH